MSRWKLTHKQLVALGPCTEGLELFDELAPRGTFATKKPERAEEAAKRSPEYARWIENVLPTQEGARSGYGYGYGYGYGDGYGSGSWDGSGDGYGDGSGDGYGDGSGYGSGDGYGDGYVTRAGARILEAR